MIKYHNFTSQWLSRVPGTQDINEKRGPMHVSLGPRKKVIKNAIFNTNKLDKTMI